MNKIRDILKNEKLNQDDFEEGDGNILNTSVEGIAKTFAKYKYIMLDIEATNEFLGIDPNEQFKLQEMYPGFMNPMISQSVEQYINEKSLRIVMEKNYRYGEKEVPVEYSNMMVARGKSKNLIQMGYLYCINNDGVKVVIMIDFVHYPKSGKVEIIFNKKDKGILENSLELINQFANNYDYLRGEKISSSGRLLDIGDYNWDDIVLEYGIRESIENNIINFFNKREIYEKNNIPFKRGIMLEGPPGTGKTLVSKILANNIKNITFILATAADIEDASDISNIFNMARRYAPSIIFMEDIDFLAQNRSSSSFARITGELLNQLDGIEDNKGIVVVATTNHQELLDEAIVHRPGRFDVMIHVGELGLENRIKLLYRFLDGRQKTEDVNFTAIAEKCEGFTGSHMKELANSVCILAINQNSLDDSGYIILLNEHFDEAIERIRKHSNLQLKDNNIKIMDKAELIDAAERYEVTEDKPAYYQGFDGFLFKKEKIK
jgi:cell division protease FtsH